ncbi:MAG: hypothetical protein JSV42_02990 [Chloroflexota bacterium]|nr:MAG: hypothetical protein JSV42_02990 [Chloroflexota bacterium]
MHHNAATADGLGEAVVVDIVLYTIGAFPPDTDAEGVGSTVTPGGHKP